MAVKKYFRPLPTLVVGAVIGTIFGPRVRGMLGL